MNSRLLRSEVLLFEFRNLILDNSDFLIRFHISENSLDNLLLLIIVNNREIIFISCVRSISAELPSAERMICRNSHAAPLISDKRLNALFNLGGGFLCKCKCKDRGRLNAIFDHISDLYDKNTCFSSTRRCAHKVESFVISDYLLLCFVQAVKKFPFFKGLLLIWRHCNFLH